MCFAYCEFTSVSFLSIPMEDRIDLIYISALCDGSWLWVF
jgi:hypothetical protein